MDKFVILGVATNWNNAKGLSDYIEISKHLSDEYKIILVGLSESQIRSLPNNIIGLTRTNNQAELAELYSAADVITSLSYGESMGLTPVEGMACGTPAIVYDNTAQPELIDEKTGICVPTGNVDSVVCAISKIKDLGKETFSDNCVNRARNLFDKNDYLKNYLELYKSLVTFNS